MSRADDLRDEIQRIASQIAPAASRSTSGRAQIEAAIAKLEARMATIPPGARRNRRRQEWERLVERVDRLSSRLTETGPEHVSSAAPDLAHLRRLMRELVGLIRADPFGSTAEATALTGRIAALVRGRRDALADSAARLADAREYVVDVIARLETLIADVSVEGTLTAAPLADLRGDLSRRIEMAEIAFEEARDRVRGLGASWPELRPISTRRDWQAIPFLRIRQLITGDPGGSKTTKGPPATADLREALSTSRAVALWIEELRQAVQNAAPVA